MDYDTVSAGNSGVFYVAMPPWGAAPSLRGLPSSPALIAAATGMMATQISASGEPMYHRIPLAAYATGVMGALAVVSALRARQTHNAPGQRIEVSQLAGAMALLHAADREMLNRHPMGCCGPIAPYRCAGCD